MDDCSTGRPNVSRLASHEFWRSRNLHYHRTIKIALAICESGLAGCEILFGGVGWIATYIRLTPLDDLTATLIEVSIARDMN